MEASENIFTKPVVHFQLCTANNTMVFIDKISDSTGVHHKHSIKIMHLHISNGRHDSMKQVITQRN